MKKLFLIFMMFSSLPSILLSQAWTQQSSGVTQHLRDVHFINRDTGYAVGGLNSAISLRTLNGGANWNPISTGSSSPFYSVLFLNAQTGYITPNGIIKTTNAALNWAIVNSIGGYDIFFLNINEGYICGGNGRIVKTIDGGKTWITLNSGVSTELKSIYFINSQTGFTATWSAQKPSITYRILRTTNSGNTWTIHKQGPSSSTTQKMITFSDSLTGYFIEGKSIIRSTNSGETWNTIFTLPSGYFNSICFPSPRIGYAAGSNGIICKTTDYGISWNYLNSGTSSILYSIYFIDTLNGYAVGQDGIILKTNTGGITMIEQSSELAEDYSLSQNYPNPFNPSTNISFTLPHTEKVNVSIYNAAGEHIETIVNEWLNTGSYIVHWVASGKPSGVYFYKLQAGEYTDVKKMVMIK